MGWLMPKRRERKLPLRFATLQAMTPDQRRSAFAGPDGRAWIEAAAQFGLVEGQVLLAQSLLDRGNAVLALRWFRAAAGAGYPPAQNMVGRCLELGWGMAPDLPDAARYYRLAAEAGLEWGQFNLGMVLLYGLGVPRDRAAAFHWFERAAEQGLPKAANMLGRFHEEGWDRPRDLVLAARFYRTGAAGGDFRAQFNLATLLLASNRAEALGLLRTAWTAGTPDFRAEAAAAMRGTGDPELAAIAA